MAKNFSDLADRAKAGWSEDTRRVYDSASAEFIAEVDERAQLGTLLACVRKARSLTQLALSEISGIQQAEISRIESGTGNPTAETLLRLADAMGQRVTLIRTKD